MTNEKAIHGGAHFVRSILPIGQDGVRDTAAATSRRILTSAAAPGALACGLIAAAAVWTHAAAAPVALPGGHGAAQEHALAAGALVSGEYAGQRDLALAGMLALDPMRRSRAVHRRPESAARSEGDVPVGGVWVSRESYQFSERDSGAKVAVTAETPPGDSRPGQVFDVSLSTRPRAGGAAGGTDYAPISVHVRFAPADFVLAGDVWRARKEIPLAIVNDMTVEDDEALDLLLEPSPVSRPAWAVLREADGAAPCAAARCFVPVTILDDDGPSTGVAVRLSVHDVSESAGGQGARVTVTGTLNREPLAEETVLTLRVVDGTATAPDDYARVEDFSLTVDAGETAGTASFTLVPVDDRIDEDDETVTVMVVDSSDLDIVWSDSSEVVIVDDDTRGIEVSTYLVPVDEGNDATYTVRLESEPTGTVTVAPSRASGDPDVTVFPTLEFNSLNWEISQTVTVSAAEDLDAEDDSAVIGHSVSGGDYGNVAVEPVMVSVADDETESTAVALSVEPSVVPEGAAATPVLVTAMLNGGSRDVDTRVDISVEPGSAAVSEDFDAVSPVPFIVTIPAGAVSGSGSFSLSPVQDSQDEPDETVTIAGTLSEANLAVLNAVIVIEDDDAVPTLSLRLSPASIVEDGGESRVTASLSHASSVVTTVAVSAVPVGPATDEDFALSAAMLTIAAGSTMSDNAAVIMGVDNDVDSADKTVTVDAKAENTLKVSGPETVTLRIKDDDERGVELSTGRVPVNEGETAIYTVRLASEPVGEVLVVPTPEDVDSDVIILQTPRFDASNWKMAQTVTVLAAEDPDANDDIAVIRHVVSGADYDDLVAGSITVEVDDDEVPSDGIMLSAVPASVVEGEETQVAVTATLNGGTRDVDTGVVVTVNAGSASEEADFDFVALFDITIPAGLAVGTETFTFSPAADDLDEPDETVRIAGDATGTVLAVTGALLTIEDGNASPTVSLMVTDTAIGEAGAASTVTASLSHASSEETTVAVSATPVAPALGTDITLSGTILTIAAGSTTSTGAVVITAVDNDVDTEDKSVSVEGIAENRLGVIGPVPVALVIEDDDERGVQVSTDLLQVDEGSSETYAVRLASEPTGEVSVAPARISGDPDVSASPTLIFTSSSWKTAQTVTVSAAHDLDAKDDAAVIGFSVSGGDYGSVVAAPVTVSVRDDEMESTEVSLSAEPALVPEGAAATPIVVTALLNGGSRDGNLEVSVLVEAGSAAEDEDYAAVAPFTITIPAGAVSGSETVTLMPMQDSVDEPDETITLLGESLDQSLPVLDAVVAIEDDDAVPTFLLSLSDTSIAEDGGSSTVSATLSHASSIPTAISVSASPVAPAEGGDFEQSGTALSIAAGSTESTGTVEISAVDNDVDTPDRIVSVAGHAENILGVSGPVAVLLTIADDDIAEISASPDALEVAEGDESGTSYALALNSRPTGDVTVVVSGMAGTDVSVRPSSLVFTAQTWQGLQEIRVTAGADADSVNDAVILEHRASGGGYDSTAVATVSVTVLDDDRRIVLSATPPAIDEGADPGSVEIRASYDGELADTEVTVRVVVGGEPAPDRAIAGTDYQPVDSLEIVIPAGEAGGTGTFTFTPIEDNLVEPDEAVSIAGAANDPDIQISGTAIVIADNDEEALPTISILDSIGNEKDRLMSFELRLDAASDVPVRVRYATAEDTALAGIDYESRSGIMVFEPGKIRAELHVDLFADSVDEGKERFLVLLSDPENAELADSEAVGTITNTDALPGAWLLRFGRAVAGDVAESIANRGNSTRDAGVEVRIANQSVAGTAGRTLSGGDGFRWLGSTSGRDVSGFGARATPGWSSERLRSRAVSEEEFLEGTSYSATGVDPDGNSVSIWGRGSVSRFKGSDRGVSLEGDAATGLIGADYTSGSTTIGLLFSRSTGDGTYGPEGAIGEVAASLTGVYPYFHAVAADRMSLWGVAGYGTGSIRLEPREGPGSEAGSSMAMAAFGAGGSVGKADAVDLAIKTDALFVRTRSKRVPGLNATDSQAHRVRIALDGSYPVEVEEVGLLVPSLDVGVQHDGGDAESGYGVDLGGGIAARDASTGISAELRGRTLLVHEAEGIREWGLSGSLRYDPAPSTERGLELSLTSSRGASTRRTGDALGIAGVAGGSVAVTPRDAALSIETEIGYGLPLADGMLTGRPSIGFGRSGSVRTHRAGFALGLEGSDRVDLEIGMEAYRRIRHPVREFGAGISFGLRW